MAEAIVGRWGHDLAVLIPNGSARGFVEGQRLDVVASSTEIIIRRLPTPTTVAQLLAKRPPEQWRALYVGAFDWGDDVGRERVEKRGMDRTATDLTDRTAGSAFFGR